MKFLTPLLALSLVFTAVPALADDDCEVPVQNWQSREAVMRHATDQGWQVQRLKIDDGCYEVRGQDAQGRRFKAKLDPQTLRVVKMKLHGPGHAREREPRRERSATPANGPTQNAIPTTAPTPVGSPVLTPGTTPRGQIE